MGTLPVSGGGILIGCNNEPIKMRQLIKMRHIRTSICTLFKISYIIYRKYVVISTDIKSKFI